MAAGNIVSNITSVTNASTFAIQANSGEEWVIHNIFHTKDCGLLLYNGTLVGTMSLLTGYNIEANLQFHVTNSIYLLLSCASAQIVGFDGVRTA